jgi:hypothetical protein
MLLLLAALAITAAPPLRPAPPPRAPSAEEIDASAATLLRRATAGEPALKEVQSAAARQALRSRPRPFTPRRARLAALLPKLSAELQRDDRRYHVAGLTSTSEVDYVRHTPGTQVSVRLAWDLGGLAVAEAEPRLASDGEAAAKASAEAVERATRLYFERQRLLLAVVALPAASPRERAERELEIAELGGILDALTGGLWSAGGTP